MKTDDKIRYFYDNMKINGSFLEKKSKFPISLAIPAAVSIAVGVAIFLAPILIKNTPEEERA